jgi:carboxyl-terminal processing protease
MFPLKRIFMNRRFVPLLLVILLGGFIFAFQSLSRQGGDNPKTRHERILRNVALLLEEGHYSPKKIDDKFSASVLKSFLKELDEDKTIFLQKDIDSFNRFSTKIDDEIRGASSLRSFYAISDSYTRRLNEVSKIFPAMLNKPFDFSREESVNFDSEKSAYPLTEAERTEVWRKRVKYMVLARYYDMLEDRDNNSKKTLQVADSVVRSNVPAKKDSTLEREARDQVRRQLDRYFTTLKNHNKPDELFSTFINAITTEMDPHSTYFAPIDTRGFNESMSGKFYGIGAQLKEEDNKIKISSLIAGGPAWKSGELSVNDEIMKIGQGKNEPVDVTGYSVTDAVKLIRGSESGTEVRLTVRKIDGSTKVIVLKRDEIKLDDTFARSAIIQNGSEKIGYIYLPEFYFDFERPNGAKCSEDVAREVTKLKAENVSGIIMDLRGNGGGSLPEVVKMVGLFVGNGPVCQVKSRDMSRPLENRATGSTVLYTGPLTVLVDEFSASASEIFAAAIQDYKRGVIIGSSSTYGKGTVQRTIPLSPESELPLADSLTEDLGTLKLTLQKFYRINGGTTQLKGVTPDVVLPSRYELFKGREKDNPTALSWDEIPQAKYKPIAIPGFDSALVQSNRDVASNKVFSSIRSQVNWIDKFNDKQYPLQLNKYRDQQRQLKAAYKNLDTLSKLRTVMKVTNAAPDLAAFSADSAKQEKNKQFVDRIDSDIVIQESLQVMNRLIGLSDDRKEDTLNHPIRKN